MPIPMNANPESGALIGAAWPPAHINEDEYLAEAQNEMRNSATADTGAGTARNVAGQTSDTFKGEAGSAFQTAMNTGAAQLRQQESRHRNAAATLTTLGETVRSYKLALNGIDEVYHANKAAAAAASVGADPVTSAATMDSIRQSAVAEVTAAQHNFTNAYEKLIHGLQVEADRADGKGTPVPGTAPIEVVKNSGPGDASEQANTDDSTEKSGESKGSDSETAPTDGPDTSATSTEGEEQAATPPPTTEGEEQAATAPPPVVAPGGGGQANNGPGSASTQSNSSNTASTPVGADSAAAEGVSEERAMGHTVGSATSEFGAGLVSGLAGQPAPGQPMMGGYPQQPMMGGYPQQPMMGGYPQQNMMGGLPQQAGSMLSQAGNSIGALGNQVAGAMMGQPQGGAGLANLLGSELSSGSGESSAENALAGLLGGGGPDTDPTSLLEDLAVELGAEDSAADSAEDDDDSGGGGKDDTKPASSDQDKPGQDKPAAPPTAADEPKESAPAADQSPATSRATEGSPISPSQPQSADPVTRLQTAAGDLVDQIHQGAHTAIDGAADAARTVMPPPPSAAPAVEVGTHTSSGAAMPTMTPLADTGLSQGSPSAPAGAPAAGVGGLGVGGAPAMAATGGPGAMAAPVPPAPATPTAPAPAGPYSGHHGPVQSNVAPTHPAVSETGAGDRSAPAAPTVPITSLFPGLPAAEIKAHQTLVALREQQRLAQFLTPTAVGVFVHQGSTHYVVATADGISYLPRGVHLPEQAWLLGEVYGNESFYRRWRGYISPAAKLIAAASEAPETMGTLTVIITSDTQNQSSLAPGSQVFAQSPDMYAKISGQGLAAPIGRSRADLAQQVADEDYATVDSLMKQNRINVADYDLYRSHVQSLRWDAQENRSAYLPAWLSMLVAEAKMAIDDPSEHDLGYILRELYIALGELRHGAGVAAQQQAGPAPLQMVQ